jgi:hypothetical protein
MPASLSQTVYSSRIACRAEVNGCADSPCGSIENAKAGSCQNKGAPLAGFTCGCDAGYKWCGRQCVGEHQHGSNQWFDQVADAVGVLKQHISG